MCFVWLTPLQMPTRTLLHHLQHVHNAVTAPAALPMLECPNHPCLRLFATRAQMSALVALCLSAPRTCPSCNAEQPCLEALRRHACEGRARVPVLMGMQYAEHDHAALCRPEGNPRPPAGWLCTLCKVVNAPSDRYLDFVLCAACKQPRCCAFMSPPLGK